MSNAEVIFYIERLADILDEWADESELGGWSTHQVKANRDEANKARRFAARLKRTIPDDKQDAVIAQSTQTANVPHA